MKPKVFSLPRDPGKSRLLKMWEQIKKEMETNPRTRFQCIARGCDGCAVCKPEKYAR